MTRKMEQTPAITPRKTTVFWDLYKCPVQEESSFGPILRHIETTLNKFQPCKVSVRIYYDPSRVNITRDEKRALKRAGIRLKRGEHIRGLLPQYIKRYGLVFNHLCRGDNVLIISNNGHYETCLAIPWEVVGSGILVAGTEPDEELKEVADYSVDWTMLSEGAGVFQVGATAFS